MIQEGIRFATIDKHKNGFTQGKIAISLGISKKTVNKWMK